MRVQPLELPGHELQGLDLPIDRILDTVRTAVNVEGDMVGSLIVQKLAEQQRKSETQKA